jgi:8-oxo-dGTP diphosphatase
VSAQPWKYVLLRGLGRFATRTAALLTLGEMPPFVSTSAIVVTGEQILVVDDPIRQEPTLPGGHLKWKESPVAAVVREVREETGLRVQVGSLVGVFAGVEWAGEPGVVRVVYEANVVGGALRPSHEGEARWVALQTLLNGHSRDVPLIRGWLQRRDAAQW